ncbi:hypothetical protein HK102_003987, partial [Quaeritorhiza haematococci]
LGERAAGFAELSARRQTNLEDVALILQEVGMDPDSLLEFGRAWIAAAAQSKTSSTAMPPPPPPHHALQPRPFGTAARGAPPYMHGFGFAPPPGGLGFGPPGGFMGGPMLTGTTSSHRDGFASTNSINKPPITVQAISTRYPAETIPETASHTSISRLIINIIHNVFRPVTHDNSTSECFTSTFTGETSIERAIITTRRSTTPYTTNLTAVHIEASIHGSRYLAATTSSTVIVCTTIIPTTSIQWAARIFLPSIVPTTHVTNRNTDAHAPAQLSQLPKTTGPSTVSPSR